MQLIYFHEHSKNPQKWTRHKPNVLSKYSNTVFGLLHICFCFLSLLSYCNNKTYRNHLICIIFLSGWARHWWGSWNKWTWWSQGKLKIKDMLWFRIWFICHFEKMKCVLLYRPTVNGKNVVSGLWIVVKLLSITFNNDSLFSEALCLGTYWTLLLTMAACCNNSKERIVCEILAFVQLELHCVDAQWKQIVVLF